MNLDYLKTYIYVIRSGNFSEVAKKLSISQPAVSFQIQKLERDLGVRLIERGKKKISITEAGKLLLQFAESVQMEQESLLAKVDRIRDQVSGELSAAASTIPGEFILPALLAEFTYLHPAVNARLTVSDSVNVINGVLDGNYEVGFCGISPNSEDLIATKISQDEIVLIVPLAHHFTGRSAISPNELSGESFIFREVTSGTQQNVQAMLLRAGVDSSQCVTHLVLGSTQAVISAVENGAGIAFVSNLAIKKSLDLGMVKEIPVNGLMPKRDFFLVYRRDRHFYKMLDEFIAFIEARAP
ncbi:MAG: selenium metabolism-associated LysR family transcriptional regulator [Dehalococcoidales bacterium]